MPWPPSPESAALLDPGIVAFLERMNAVPGVETLQSCSGDHPGAEKPPHVWLAGRLSDRVCWQLQAEAFVDAISVLYGREANPVTEIVFTTPAGFEALCGWLEARKRIHRANPNRDVPAPVCR